VEGGRVTGMRLTNSEGIAITSSVVVASNVNSHYLIVTFLGEDLVGPDLIAKMQRDEWGDAYLVIYLALDGPVTCAAGPEA